MLTRHDGLGTGLPVLLGLQREEAFPPIFYLLCLHDVGKFARRFQAIVPVLYPRCFGDDPGRMAKVYDHGAGGLRLFDADESSFKLPVGGRSGVWRPLISAVTGHHGTPPAPRMNETITTLRSDFGAPGIDAARGFAHQAHELFALPAELTGFGASNVRRASFALAGLAVLADWIGSNQTWFRYRSPDDFEDLEDYLRYAREKADRAVVEAGVLPAPTRNYLGYDALIGPKATPTPMQDWTSSVELPAGPALFMIEDETGSGKTEAALMLAHRLMTANRADGLYVALPTMATANAMFDRLGAACRKLFTADSAPSIALAHGARDLHDGFRSAVLRGGRKEASYSDTVAWEDESGTTASMACAYWIADDRRRAFLADVGAGTVDQALLSVLPSRHQSLRLLGLMRRVLVLDEIHAYDSYMQREIETMLEFQAGLGGSVILLSATLPLTVRARLAAAFSKGLGKQADITELAAGGMNYPLATVRAADVRSSIKVQGQSGRARNLPVRFLRTAEDAFDAVEEAVRSDESVLYVRNTVDDVLDAWSALSARGLAPVLFHARFTLGDRLRKERYVVKTFGKESGEYRAAKVLVATQVVEQSLDLDFDALISDLAPIDLLIQRAGRLWRHDRPNRRGFPELLVVGPPAVACANADWFKSMFPRAAYVYRDHARLWLTASVLEKEEFIRSPGGLRLLIETVYGDDAEMSVPNDLMGSFFDAEGRAGAERGVATTNVLALGKGYVRDSGAWASDTRTPTRLVDDPHVTLRLACVRDGRIEPFAQEVTPDEPWRAWRFSEVTVSTRRVKGEFVAPELAAAARDAKAGWTRFDAEKILAVLKEDTAAGFSGEVLTGDDGSTRTAIHYNSDRGLTFG